MEHWLDILSQSLPRDLRESIGTAKNADDLESVAESDARLSALIERLVDEGDQ